jgi:hypothetical protein
MNYLEQQMKDSKDYQLQSLISQFTRFKSEVTTNTAESILRDCISAAKTECDNRGISYN